MKKTGSVLFSAVLFVLCIAAGCAKNNDTPSTLYVTASASYNAGTAAGVVSLTKNTSGGDPVTGATVKFNNQVMAEVGSGSYGGGITGLTTGATITLSITSSEGNASSSGKLPTGSGSSKILFINGAVFGSLMVLFNI